MSLAIYNLPTHIRYNGTSPPIDFLDKYNTISNLYQWSENHKCHMLRFFFEAFYFAISNILDKMSIVDPTRHIQKYINLLPTEIARSLALSFQKNELDILIQLKQLDNYHRSIDAPTTSQPATACNLDMATNIAHAIINHLDYNPFTEEEDNISYPEEIGSTLL
jgi:hypothetical protein